MNLEQKTSDELSLMVDEWEKKIREADNNVQIVEENNISISKELINLRDLLSHKRQEQLDNEIMVKKANHNLRSLRSERSEIERAYWRSKGK